MILLSVSAVTRAQAVITRADYEATEHLVVRSKHSEWWYDAAGGGFSRIVDRNGQDWVGFRREPWNVLPASAASSYRGLPNLVFGGERNGAGHPGFDRCISRVAGGGIVTETRDGTWRWRWAFHDDYAVLRIEQKGEEPYWFLYEGVPGGRYAPQRWYWGNDVSGPLRRMPDFVAGERATGPWRWAYFGADDSPRVFFVARVSAEESPSSFGVMGNTREGLASPDGMTVFGFGRAREAKPLLARAPAVFVCGFLERRVKDARGHARAARFIGELAARLDDRGGSRHGNR